jgi:RimJ/RimL family protein N-acetyltransferase
VESKVEGTRLGLCGLIKRDTLEDVDLGFAFLERHQGKGYAREAARATLEEARGLGLPRVAAITSQDNGRSIHLLAALGFRFQDMRSLTPGEPPVRFFLWQSPDSPAGTAV